jgi:hypothetical protein
MLAMREKAAVLLLLFVAACHGQEITGSIVGSAPPSE